ncbi:MAG: MarR family winged helix-turn-helix transcriptional regulator [Thermoproteota archaeon]
MDEEKVQQLGKWEIQILQCVKVKSRTEKQIAKMIGLDSSIVSPMITDLIMNGHLDVITKRRLYFFFRKFYALTPSGLAVLDGAKRHSWDGIIMEIKSRVSEIIKDARDQSPTFNATWQVANAGYKITKFILSK